jgi:hypothetical protein
MKYHSLKMAEINKIIKEYWINTYKGNGMNIHPIEGSLSEKALTINDMTR